MTGRVERVAVIRDEAFSLVTSSRFTCSISVHLCKDGGASDAPLGIAMPTAFSL